MFGSSFLAVCPKNWVKHETSCYKFFQHPKKQFAAASKQCKELNSHLLFIESQREDEFLARHLLKAFPYVYNWRTGGRRINGTMKWSVAHHRPCGRWLTIDHVVSGSP